MDSSNVYSLVYDLTNNVLYVAFESGTGETWVKAADNGFIELRLSDLILRDSGGM
jgi:hypothetical protein